MLKLLNNFFDIWELQSFPQWLKYNNSDRKNVPWRPLKNWDTQLGSYIVFLNKHMNYYSVYV